MESRGGAKYLTTVTSIAEPSPFRGIRPTYLQSPPEPDDFVVLAPGETITVTVDLPTMYDLRSPGSYEAHAQVYIWYTVGNSSSITNIAPLKKMYYHSDNFRLDVDPNIANRHHELRHLEARAITHASCDSAQNDTIRLALKGATALSLSASNEIEAGNKLAR